MTRENFAQPNFDKLQEGADGPKELGKGGGVIKRSKKGTGVRADQLAEGSETHLHKGMDLKEIRKKRMNIYREVVKKMGIGWSEEQLNMLLQRIYEEHVEDLEQGGFLQPDYVRGIISRLLYDQMITSQEGESLWEATMEQLPVNPEPAEE